MGSATIAPRGRWACLESMEHFVKEGKAKIIKLKLSSKTQAAIVRNSELLARFVCIHADIAADAEQKIAQGDETQARKVGGS